MSPRNTAVQGFYVQNGTYLIRNTATGAYLKLLDPKEDGAVVTAFGENKPTHWWVVTDMEDGAYSIMNKANLGDSKDYYVKCSKSVEGSPVVVRSGPEDIQHFYITECLTYGYYRIQPAFQDVTVELYWSLSDEKYGTQVELHASSDMDSNQWSFIPVNFA